MVRRGSPRDGHLTLKRWHLNLFSAYALVASGDLCIDKFDCPIDRFWTKVTSCGVAQLAYHGRDGRHAVTALCPLSDTAFEANQPYPGLGMTLQMRKEALDTAAIN